MQKKRSGIAGLCCLVAMAGVLLGVNSAQAGIDFSLNGPGTASICDTITLTNTLTNTGRVLGGLMVTNTLPANLSYVSGQTVIELPDGVVRTNAAADPSAIVGQNLVWDFSDLVSSCKVTRILITEVYYNDTHTSQNNKEGYQWVELYNPTTSPQTLTGWKLRDANPGKEDALPTMTIAAGEFVIVAGSTQCFYSVSAHAGYTGQVFQVYDGQIGNGLNDYGDGVALINASAAIEDAMSYGNSTVFFSTPAELSDVSGSCVRFPAANADTDTALDWDKQGTPEPGLGDLPEGLQPDDGVTIRYKAAGSCSAATGQFAASAGCQQPPGGSNTTGLATAPVTLNSGDLTIFMSPLTQSKGRYDFLAWEITVKNVGAGNAKNVVITDRLSSGFSLTNCNYSPSSITTSNTTKVITWDGSAIPALADLAPDASVTVTVTGRVESVSDLSNRADVRWGCTTNSTCEDSIQSGETVTAGLNLIDRVPQLSGWITPSSPISVPYCQGTNLVLHITNGLGEAVGTAYSVVISNTIPAGWTLSGAEVDGNSVIHAGDIEPGGSTNLTVNLVPGGSCPIFTNLQTTYFTFTYHDATDRSYGPPTLYTAMQVVQSPSASVRASVPGSQTATTNGLIPVEVYYAYTNFSGSEQISFTNTYTAGGNLTPTNISENGYVNGASVVWTNSGLTNSGVYTGRFDLAISDVCGEGVRGYINNTVTAPSFSNCHGCPTPVTGSGEIYSTYLYAGVDCAINGGEPGSCSYSSIKVAPTSLVEVCQTVFVSHSFTNFTGSLPGWSNVLFSSNLGGVGDGDADTNDVTVMVNGSNVTSFCTMSYAPNNLLVNLSGLTSSVYSDISVVTNLTVTWGMSTLEPGRVEERSVLNMPVCGSAGATVFWNVGASAMSVSLAAIEYLEACGVTTGRIDLAQLTSPGLLSGSNRVFASYDVRVTLNLDADGNHGSQITYEPDSTVFSNMVLLGGATTNGFNPVVTSTQLVWTIGDLDPNGAGFITYVLRGACSRPDLEKQAAKVEYNTYCSRGYEPTNHVAFSVTNAVPTVAPAGNLLVAIQPEVTFLTDTQYVVRLSFLNTGAGTAYNVTPRLIVPTNVVFLSASVTNCSVTTTSVVWSLENALNPGDLFDADGDGFKDDLRPLGQFDILVTNGIAGFSQTAIHAAVSHGCNTSTCQTATSLDAIFESNSGSLIAQTSFPANGKLCQGNPVEIAIWNSGQIRDYDVRITEVLPAGVTYVPSSSYFVTNGVTNSVADPVITSGSNLVWTSSQITPFAGVAPDGRVTILFQTLAACSANTSDLRYSTSASYRDIAQNLVTISSVAAIQGLDLPVPSIGVTASSTVVDYNRTNIYTLVIDTTGSVDIPAMLLEDTLSDKVTYLGASRVPDYTNGQVLVWSNATLMELSGGTPYTSAKAAISITVTGLVTGCNYLYNDAKLYYGCDPDSLCLNKSTRQTSISIPLVTVGNGSVLSLTTWGGTRTVVVTNQGATATGIIVSNVAPSGFVFTDVASITGEFIGTPLVTLSGSPSGKIALIDLTSTTTSGELVDGEDDAGDGAASLDLGSGKGCLITLNLINDGSGMDSTANPQDWGYVDPEPVVSSQVTAPVYVTYSNLCVQIQPTTVAQSASAIPVRPDPDICLTPQSIVLTNSQRVGFTVSVVNGADSGTTTNLHVRMQLGEGWSNLVCVSTQITQSGSGTLEMEMKGSTNVFIEMNGFALNTLNDQVVLNFEATVVQGQGPLSILAEVVGVSPVNPVSTYTYIGTNTLGALPLANSLTGTTVTAVSGAYYAFDQCQMSGAGFEITKTVRYAGEDVSSGVNQLSARIGESLLFHISATFFGASFSNAVLTNSHEVNLSFGTPLNRSGTITDYTYDAPSGVFHLQPTVFDGSAGATFSIDVPATVVNSDINLAGVSITNIVTPDFTVVGMTNAPPGATNFVSLIEPVLGLTMASDTNNIQAGDIVTFTNIITQTGSAGAYDIVFSNSLPEGMTFSNVTQVSSGTINGAIFSATSNDIPALGSLLSGDITIIIKAKVMNQLVGSTLSNAATIHYTSMPGTPSEERNGSGGINNYTASASIGILAMPLTGVSKLEGASSETGTTSPYLTIGERILYTNRVDVPNGVSTNLQITDQLPPGLGWVGPNSDALLTYPGAGYRFIIPEVGPVLSTNLEAGLVITALEAGHAVRFTVDSITNTPDGNSLNNYFDLVIECVVLNDTDNNIGKSPLQKSWSNQVIVADGFSARTNTSPAYIIAEPDLMIGHTLSPVSGADAGDVVTVTLFVTNSTYALANAYDVVVLDKLSLAFFDPASVVMETPAPGWILSTNVVGGNLEYRFSCTPGDTALPPHTIVTNRFTVRLAQAVAPNMTVINSVELQTSDTIKGTPPDGIDPRFKTSSATLLTLTTPNVAITKAFEATSETNTVDSMGQNVQIGEMVTYKVVVTVPEGTVSNLMVMDLLPAGMQYVTNRVDVTTPVFGGTLGSPMSVTTNASGATLVFSNATVVTTNNDAGDNSFWVYVDAVVQNVAGNNGLSGSQTYLMNRASVNFTGNTLPAMTNNPAVVMTNVEPRIWIGTSFSTNRMDGGDLVTVSLVVSNTGLATAYDVVVTDQLDTVFFDVNTVTNFKMGGVAATGYVMSVSSGLVTIQSDTNSSAQPTNSLEVNETITFTFDVNAGQTLPPNMVITNRVGVYADTVAGYAAQQRVVTGLVATATNTSPNFVITKDFSATSETNTVDSTGQNVQIGETVTYKVVVTVPEGTVSNLTVMDLLPAGMQYVTNRVDVTTPVFGGTLGSPMSVTTNASGATLVFSNATVVTTNNDAGDNSFWVYVDAVVQNVAGNTGRVSGAQTILSNKATVNFTGNSLSAVTNSPAVAVTNVEPIIAISKSFSTNWMQAGDLITVTLVVSNTGLATAYDLVVTDAVNTAYFVTNNSVASFDVNGQSPTGYIMGAIAAGMIIQSDTNSSLPPTNSLEVGEVLTFHYTMTAAQTVSPNTTVTLPASFRADTMAGTPSEQRILTTADALASVSIPNFGILKVLKDSARTNLCIGETATYVISVPLPAGTVENLAVTDWIPAGMQYVTNRRTIPAGMTMGAYQVTGGDGYGVPVVISFAGNTVVENNNSTLGIEIDAVVLNTNLNSGLPGSQTVFTNKAMARLEGAGANTMTSSVVYAYAIEPSLKVIKTMSGPTNGVVTVSLVLTNEGLAAAYDVVVTDRLDAVYFHSNTLVATLMPDGFTFATNDSATVFTLASDANSTPPTNSIEAGEAVAFRFTAQSIPNAGRSVTNVAVIVSNSTISGSSDWERVEPFIRGTNVLLLPMFSVTKSLSSPLGRAADVGETVRYFITVTNLGSLGLGTVLVSDAYPTNTITYSNAVPAPTTVLDSGTLVWSNVGPVSIAGATNITVNFTALHNTLPGVMTNWVTSAVVATNGASPVPRSDYATNSIVPSYHLSKTVSFPVGRSAVTSGPAIFLISVTNSGDIRLKSIQLDDTFDSAVLQFTNAPGVLYTPGAGSLVWTNLGGLGVGEVASVTGSFKAVNGTGAGKTTNTVISTAVFETFSGVENYTTYRTNLADLRVTIPIGLTVGFTNPPPGGDETFQITAVSGAVYHVISVSNNIDHPHNQDWRLMVTWSNMPNWVSYKDSNVVQEVSNTRFYQIVWEEAGVVQTNPVMYEAFVQNLTTGIWHELAMPVECFDYSLSGALGRKLATGLHGGNINDGDLLYALKTNGVWGTYVLNASTNWAVSTNVAMESSDTISPSHGYWIKRRTGGISTNIEYAGPVRLETEAIVFESNKWRMISWPFPRSRREDFGAIEAEKGWGFSNAGAHCGNSWNVADLLYVSSGTNTVMLYLKPDGRWYKINSGVRADEIRLQHGVGYYYYHRGTGFTWTAKSPPAGTLWY